jgi:hypothetical protein
MHMLISIKNNRDNSPIFRKTTPIKIKQGKTSHNSKKQAVKNLIALKGYCSAIDL